MLLLLIFDVEDDDDEDEEDEENDAKVRCKFSPASPISLLYSRTSEIPAVGQEKQKAVCKSCSLR